MSKEYKAFDLNERQLEKFGEMHRNKYGSSGAFIGMCSKMSSELSIPFEKVLSQNIDYAIQADLTEKALTDKENEEKQKIVEERKEEKPNVKRSF
ncbi:MAG: hypothetical protein ACTSWQ_02355 [Candidatus Thorarchaeota archaeon]